MKITFVTSKLNFRTSGGSVEEIDYILRRLLDQGHEITVITTAKGKNDIPNPLPYKVIEESVDFLHYFSMQRGIYRILKQYEGATEFYLVDAHNFMYGAGCYRLFGGKIPVGALVNQFLTCIPQHVSSLFPQTKDSLLLQLRKKNRYFIERYIGTWFANHVDIFAFVSPNVRVFYEEFWRKSRPQDFVIGDPIDIPLLMREGKVTEDSYRKRIKYDGKITIFYSSRMSPGKGFDILLTGFSKVKNKDKFRVILGGTGPETPYVEQMVKDLQLSDYVTLPGWVDKEQLFQYYREADIFIQADWWVAGTSISVLYALLFGVPMILPGGGGLQWNAGEGALYFPYRDTDSLARCIEQLGDDAVLRTELSENCYKRIKQDDMNYPQRIKLFAERMQEIRHTSSLT